MKTTRPGITYAGTMTPAEHRALLAHAAFDPKASPSARELARRMLADMGGLTAEEEAAMLRFFGLTTN